MKYAARMQLGAKLSGAQSLGVGAIGADVGGSIALCIVLEAAHVGSAVAGEVHPLVALVA